MVFSFLLFIAGGFSQLCLLLLMVSQIETENLCENQSNTVRSLCIYC